jgi:hypothetical protein
MKVNSKEFQQMTKLKEFETRKKEKSIFVKKKNII